MISSINNQAGFVLQDLWSLFLRWGASKQTPTFQTPSFFSPTCAVLNARRNAKLNANSSPVTAESENSASLTNGFFSFCVVGQLLPPSITANVASERVCVQRRTVFLLQTFNRQMPKFQFLSLKKKKKLSKRFLKGNCLLLFFRLLASAASGTQPLAIKTSRLRFSITKRNGENGADQFKRCRCLAARSCCVL